MAFFFRGPDEFVLPVSQAGNYIFEWRYTKDASVNGALDTVWLANVHFPNGTLELFDSLGSQQNGYLPNGWSSTGDGGMTWTLVDDPLHTYGTGRYTAKAGAITHNQTTRLRSPSIAVSAPGELRFHAWTKSAPPGDFVRLYYSTDGGQSFSATSITDSGASDETTLVKYPAKLDTVVAVGSSTDWDYRSVYSGFLGGNFLEIMAPSDGGFARVTTTDRTGTAGLNQGSDPLDLTDLNYSQRFGGTSAAAPLTAGIVALMLAKNPNLTVGEVRTKLITTTDKIGGNNGLTAYTDVPNDGTSATWNQFYGYGKVNAASVLGAVTADTVGPRVTKVTLTSADAAAPIATWDVPTGSGEQIRVSPIVDIKKISIQFSERVIISKNDLVVRGVYNYPTITTYTPTGFYVDYATNTATWEFATPLPPDKIELLLSESVRDFVYKEAVGGQPLINGNKLDGEFTNPDTVAQSGTSVLPSGNGSPGVAFCFRFTSLPGDADRNQLIDLADLNIVRNNFGLSASGGVLPQWTFGDMDFNLLVDLPDLNAVRNNFGLNYSAAWPSTGCCNCQQMMAAGSEVTAPQGEYGESALRQALADAYHARNTDKASAELFWNIIGWDQLGDDKWWNELLGVADWKAVSA